jgi:formate dehydrogenase alpha subunit
VEAVTITLNGVEVGGYAGMTILDLANEAGVYIPTLCHDKHLASTGACRLCIVEDERSGALLASCVAPINPGMIINTNSPKVLEHRRKILKLMLASHPDSCLICDKGNRCQLRKLAAEMGIGAVEFQRIPQYGTIEEVNPFIERDLSKCIMCGKCIRADQELVVEGAIDYINRGTMVKPATLNDLPLEKSECTFCGTCVAICPTGALMEKERTYSGTTTTTVDTICAYCGCGCSLSLGIKNGRIVRSAPGADGSVNKGTLCVRGSYGFEYIHSPERLTRPLIKVDEEYQESTWEEAIARVAGEFLKIRESHGSDALAVFGSSRCTNEENYLLQRFARGVLGTNNIDNGSRLYSAVSRLGLGVSIGYAGTTSSLDTLEKSPVIMVIGAEPEISAPTVAYAIKRAVRQHGAELIVVDPRRTPLVRFSRLWLHPHPGTDIALLNSLARIIIAEKKLDVEFVTRTTDNFDDWARSLEDYTPAYVEKITGIPRKNILEAARMLSGGEEASIVYGNGITQHTAGTDTVIAIANLAMLTGNNGRRGGIFALQRDCNAHGASDMGALPGFLPGYQNIDDVENRSRYEQYWGGRLPDSPGLSAIEMIEQAEAGKVKGMFIMGENPVSVFPQPERVRNALAKLDFLAVSDMFLTETAGLAAVVLPASSFAEKEGTFTNFEGRIQQLKKVIEPVGDSLPDSEIIMKLAEAMGAGMPYKSPHQVTEEIEAMVPFYRHLSYGAGSMDMDLDDVDRESPGARRLHKGLFPSGFGRFSPVEYTPPVDIADDNYPFTLLVGSGRYRFGSGARSSHSKRLRLYCTDISLEISPKDAAGINVKNGDGIRIISKDGELLAGINISNNLPDGLLFLPITSPSGSVYGLFNTTIDDRAKAPALKSCAVRLERTPDND